MKILLFLYFSLMSFWLQAQDPEEELDNETMTQIENWRVAIITQKLNLSNEQATKFWPIFNEFSKERHKIRQQIKQIYKSVDTKTDAEIKKDAYKVLDLKQQEVDLEKKYLEKFQQVLNIRQIVALHKAEHHFRKMLLEKLKGTRRGKKLDEDKE